MSLGFPSRSAPGARADIALLYSPAVDVDLGEHAAVAIGAERPQHDFAGRNHRAEPLLRCSPARLVQLGRIDVGQPYLVAITYQRVAIDGETSRSGVTEQR